MLQRPLEPVDLLAQRRVVLTQDAHKLGRIRRLGQGGEAAEAAEDDRDLAAVAAQDRLAVQARSDDQLGHLWRQIAPQAAQTLELIDLLLHARFERAVPLGELRLLALDRVVVALDAQQRADSGQQLGPVEGLGEKVVAASLERPDFLLLAASGQQDHR